MQRGHLHTEDIYIQQIQVLVVIGMQFRLGTLQEAGRWMRERMDSETTDLFFPANIGRTTGLKPAVFWFVLIPSWLNCDVLANVPLSHLLCMVWHQVYSTCTRTDTYQKSKSYIPNPGFCQHVSNKDVAFQQLHSTLVSKRGTCCSVWRGNLRH